LSGSYTAMGSVKRLGLIMSRIRVIVSNIEQRLALGADWLLRLIGLELVLTCKYCGNEIEIDNLSNHFTYHEKQNHQHMK
jgi:hypothetical protein